MAPQLSKGMFVYSHLEFSQKMAKFRLGDFQYKSAVSFQYTNSHHKDSTPRQWDFFYRHDGIPTQKYGFPLLKTTETQLFSQQPVYYVN